MFAVSYEIPGQDHHSNTSHLLKIASAAIQHTMRLPLLTTLLATPALAILVTPGSPCASKCGNVLDRTSADDLVCDEDAYGSGAGAVFKSCVECELGSSYVAESDEFSNGKESDLQWVLCEFALFLSLSFIFSSFFFSGWDGCRGGSGWDETWRLTRER